MRTTDFYLEGVQLAETLIRHLIFGKKVVQPEKIKEQLRQGFDIDNVWVYDALYENQNEEGVSIPMQIAKGYRDVTNRPISDICRYISYPNEAVEYSTAFKCVVRCDGFSWDLVEYSVFQLLGGVLYPRGWCPDAEQKQKDHSYLTLLKHCYVENYTLFHGTAFNTPWFIIRKD